ncbi:MAG: M6 family metalloprotease domain-containing protein, partial [Muribaculaceae bacterium]|nr:M6 family metalloprotease domain-containing protein [Muribaculaceae bacterium]
TLDYPKAYFEDLLMKPGFNQYGGTGSAYDFFTENSNGQFDPQFDVYGPYTLPQNRSYYGGNDGYGNDQYPEMMVYTGCRGLNDQINFADYDMDGDGYVDNVFVFYAGQGEADYGPDDSVWPHQWELSSAGRNLTLDGKKIDKYACTNEWNTSTPCGIGTFVHEFSHVMGLPDLYCTDYGHEAKTPGEWSALDMGPYNNDGRTPPAYSAFERNAMGWMEPIVLDGSRKIELEHILTSNQACLIPTSKDTEFFLLENRQQTGWDKYLPGHGMLIWHIDFVQSIWDSNAVNNTASHMYVRIVPASNNSNSEATWSWPGTSKRTQFTSTTTPALKNWAGKAIDMPITEITEQGGIIRFLAQGGVEPIPAPEALYPAVIAQGSFTASWQPVDGAVDYRLTVNALEKGTGVTTETYDGKTLPTGWTKSFNDTYTTAASSGKAIPSLKFNKTGNKLETAKSDSDITSLTFWHKGNGSKDSYMTVYGLINEQWEELDVVWPNDGQAETYTTDITPGVKQIRLVYTKKTGNMAVDDITITSGGDRMIEVVDYTDRSVGNVTSHTVSVAHLPHTTYTYCVKATDGDRVSSASKVISVNMADAAGVDDVTVDSDAACDPIYYNLQGIRVDTPLPGHIYIRRQGTHTAKVIVR